MNSDSLQSIIEVSIGDNPSIRSLVMNFSENDDLDDSSSVIFGIGDVDALNGSESILSFDGDIEKIPALI